MDYLSQLLASNQAYNSGQNVANRMELPYDEMIRRGLLRITDPGDGRGGSVAGAPVDQFSIVTQQNRTHPDQRAMVDNWPDKPSSVPMALNLFSGGAPQVSDGKYFQILDDAIKAGLVGYGSPYPGGLGGTYLPNGWQK